MKKKGFTLVEVAIVVTIIVIGLILLTGIMAKMKQPTSDTVDAVESTGIVPVKILYTFAIGSVYQFTTEDGIRCIVTYEGDAIDCDFPYKGE